MPVAACHTVDCSPWEMIIYLLTEADTADVGHMTRPGIANDKNHSKRNMHTGMCLLVNLLMCEPSYPLTDNGYPSMRISNKSKFLCEFYEFYFLIYFLISY